MTSSDRFPVPVRSAVKLNLTDWCFQNLSKRALNALTVQASTTELGKLFQIFTMREKPKNWRGNTITLHYITLPLVFSHSLPVWQNPGRSVTVMQYFESFISKQAAAMRLFLNQYCSNLLVLATILGDFQINCT